MDQRKILVAVDESPYSVHTMQYVIENVITQNDKVIVLHVYPPVQVAYPGAGSEADFALPADVFQSLRKATRQEANTIVQKFLEMLKKVSVPAEGYMMEGDAREFVVAEAEKLEADLLVLGSRGLGALKRMMMGSVSSHCVNHVGCPVLVVKDKGTEQGKKREEGEKRVVLIAVDGSDAATHAFRWAIGRYCRAERERVVLMLTQPLRPWASYAEASPYGSENNLEAETLKRNQEFLESLKKEANQKNFECQTDVEKGDAREAIAWAVDQHKADLLVVGSSGKGAFSRFFLGSVSSFCCHNLTCPVLVVKEKKGGEAQPSAPLA